MCSSDLQNGVLRLLNHLSHGEIHFPSWSRTEFEYAPFERPDFQYFKLKKNRTIEIELKKSLHEAASYRTKFACRIDVYEA